METTTGFKVGANIGPFETAMQRMVDASQEGSQGVQQNMSGIANVTQSMKQAFAQFSQNLKEVMGEAFESVKTQAKIAGVVVSLAFAAVGLGAIYTVVKVITASAGFLAGLISGSSYQTDGIDALKESVKQTEKIRDVLNVTREQASAMALAFDQVGISADDYIGTSQSLFASLISNSSALEEFGIKTNRTGDDLADFERIGGQAVKFLEQYAPGADRAAAANAAGLPTYEALTTALKANKTTFAEARTAAATYGLFISNEVAGATKEYEKAMTDFNVNMKMTWAGVSRAVTDSLMPVLTDLANFFKDGLPVAANFTRGVMGALITLFHGFTMSIYTVTETALGSIKALGQGIAGLGRAFVAVLRGDMAGAWEAIKNGGKQAVVQLGNSLDNIAARARTTQDRIRMAFLGGQEGEAPSVSSTGPNKRFVPKPKKEKAAAETPEKEVSAMQTYDQTLEYAKLAYEKENTMRQYSKQQELAYWKEILDTYEVGAKDKGAINLKIAKLEVETMRASAKDQKEITQMRADDWRAETMDYVNELQSRTAFERDQGNVTQSQYLERTAAFNATRLQAELDFIAQKMEVAKIDPENNLVLLEQLELQKVEIRRQYRQLDLQNQQEQQVASMAQFKSLAVSIESSWANSIKGVLSGTQSISQGIKGMFKGVLDSLVGMLAQMAAKWLAQQLLMKALGKAFGLGEIAKESAKAGAGGVASMAAAPFPLNLGAPAFGASMAALAMSFAPLASAAGGFDIPAGLNPMTQLHAEEMVLPASIANPLRENLADGGMGGGATNITITAMDSSSFEQFLKANPQAFAAGMKNAVRRGF